MFITRNKLFLRSALVTAKRTRASKFPAMIRTEDNMRTLHNAMPSDSEGKRFANSDAFCWLLFTADMSIILNGIQLIVKKKQNFKGEALNLLQ